ncbi:hypothetical protein [uncultured Rhodoferax sp.]|uniref:hypothetical protein n=1 Tax=uncultured Rhodoferax sp. TaxID=223188 RepID=UPI0025D2E5BF|nr:hypothetical protein [uncultured Rhodoferax sp.]
MKAWWAKQAARIDALSLRERVFLFCSVLLVLLALVDVLWLTPAQAAYKLVQQNHAAQNAELARLRAELAGLSKPVDASQPLRDQIAAADQRLAVLRQEIEALAPTATGGAQGLEAVLVQFLQRRPGLRLVSSGTMAVDSKTAGTPDVAGVQRRGLQLKVAGSYAELSRYVKSLEQALPRLRWGPMQLVVNKQVPELTLQVYVLEVQP